MSPRGRSISLATSKDFDHWTSPELVFHADEQDQELARQAIAARLADPGLIQPQHNVPEEYFVDVYNMSVFRYEGLYLGMAAFFHHTGDVDENSDGFHLVQLTCSRDLRHWERLGERRPFIGPSRVGFGRLRSDPDHAADETGSGRRRTAALLHGASTGRRRRTPTP